MISYAVRFAGVAAAGGVAQSPAALLAAFCAPWVWLVVMLKAMTAVLKALMLKACGNGARRPPAPPARARPPTTAAPAAPQALRAPTPPS